MCISYTSYFLASIQKFEKNCVVMLAGFSIDKLGIYTSQSFDTKAVTSLNISAIVL